MTFSTIDPSLVANHTNQKIPTSTAASLDLFGCFPLLIVFHSIGQRIWLILVCYQSKIKYFILIHLPSAKNCARLCFHVLLVFFCERSADKIILLLIWVWNYILSTCPLRKGKHKGIVFACKIWLVVEIYRNMCELMDALIGSFLVLLIY